ncbi:SPFH domain-containing protein [Streptomyces sp. CA-146814]|uniref:SPFH domain-containing protein n=1 Tax=Streptomyces sp. CA-146814 TaxID=3240053 RepID=UPI003D92DFFF
MTPDQNPHPLTDHDPRPSGGETPMPLVDGVALHQPSPVTPPPLFRRREETPAGEGGPKVTGGLDDPAPEAAGETVTPAPEAATDEPGAPAPETVTDETEAPAPETATDETEAPAPEAATDEPGAPPPLKLVSLAHPGRSLHLDQFTPPPQPSQPVRPHSQPVRRLRTEPSAEWTPLPAYGEEAGPRPDPAPAAQADNAEPKDAAPAARADNAEPKDAAPAARADNAALKDLDLVLDLANGARATSATVSVSVPAPQPPPSPRRHSVIAGESTAAIPVHLLFRDDPEQPEPTALPTTVARPATARTTPRPRSPHPRVEPPTRPAPLADPRLVERPGPALPGYAALLAGAAGLLGVLALLWWRGALPAAAQSAVGLAPRPYEGIGVGVWAGLALLVTVVVLALGGLGRGRVGYAWVLTLFGDYRGSVRRTGLVWVSPLLLRRRVDVRLRHWRSEPLPAVDANGTALRVVVLVVWRIKDTVRAALGIEDHEAYLSAQVESAMARVLSQLPADAFHEDAPTLRDAEAVGDALTRMLKADCEPVGVEVYSAQPTGIEYAPEVAAAMQRRRIAAIDAKHRDSVLTSVVDAVDDTVNRLTTRGIVDLDDYERKALVKDLTVAFYTGRTGGGDSV